MFRRARSLLFPGILVLALLLANVALAHQWSNWHWNRSGNPVTIGVYNTSPAGRYRTQSEAALNDWDANTIINLPRKTSHTDVSVYAERVTGVNWSGLASIESCDAVFGWCFWANGHIGHVHSRVNTYYTDGWSDYYVRGIYCQEIGHAFGLGHYAYGDCMGLTYYSGSTAYVGYHSISDIYSMYRYGHH